MTRNIENRVEVATPIYDTSLQKEIIDVFEIIWNDNIKGRRLNYERQNEFIMNKKNLQDLSLRFMSIIKINLVHEN